MSKKSEKIRKVINDVGAYQQLLLSLLATYDAFRLSLKEIQEDEDEDEKEDYEVTVR